MLYLALKFVHVASIVTWVGGVTTLLKLNSALRRANDHAGAQSVFNQGKHFSMTVFMPSAVLTLITGIGMVQVGHLGFHTPWISVGIMMLVLSIVFGGVLTGGTARKIAEGGDVKVLGPKLLLYARINALILLLTIADMVFKPSLWR